MREKNEKYIKNKDTNERQNNAYIKKTAYVGSLVTMLVLHVNWLKKITVNENIKKLKILGTSILSLMWRPLQSCIMSILLHR